MTFSTSPGFFSFPKVISPSPLPPNVMPSHYYKLHGIQFVLPTCMHSHGVRCDLLLCVFQQREAGSNQKSSSRWVYLVRVGERADSVRGPSIPEAAGTNRSCYFPWHLTVGARHARHCQACFLGLKEEVNFSPYLCVLLRRVYSRKNSSHSKQGHQGVCEKGLIWHSPDVNHRVSGSGP